MTGSLIFVLTAFLQSQDPGTPGREDKPQERKRLELDFSAGYENLSEDLEKALRWKKLFGFFGVSEVHTFPAQESGPYFGPPLRIWGNGFNTSLWRDPVTGWPLQ